MHCMVRGGVQLSELLTVLRQDGGKTCEMIPATCEQKLDADAAEDVVLLVRGCRYGLHAYGGGGGGKQAWHAAARASCNNGMLSMAVELR